MLEGLSAKFEGIFAKLRGHPSLSQADIEATLKAVKLSLLEADVNYKVVKDFCQRLAEKATALKLDSSLSPDQLIIKLVHQELTELMSVAKSGAVNTRERLDLKGEKPAVILLAGLQGSGKTTTAAKLAVFIQKELKKKVALVSADIYRPAAIEQLQTLANNNKIDFFLTNPEQKVELIVELALNWARQYFCDVLIIDTAGRLQVDLKMMNELRAIYSLAKPTETLLVVDAMTGQEAVNVAVEFQKHIELTGLILTKLDGDARGGAALSLKAVTGKPIKFIGIGEKSDALELFHPDRLAGRILGMGDVLSLIEKVGQESNLRQSAHLEARLKKGEFSFEDFLGQLRMIKKMGSFSSLMGMIPGINKLAKQVDPQQAEEQMKRIEAIILSMTKLERRRAEVINGSRRRRIAAGSGTSVQEVNQLLKQHAEMKKMFGKFSKVGLGGLSKIFGSQLKPH